jgi:hypothetical protein
MSDYGKSVEFAYSEWLSGTDETRTYSEGSLSISPQGYGPVNLVEDSLPFLKIALIRAYCNRYGQEAFDEPKTYE